MSDTSQNSAPQVVIDPVPTNRINMFGKSFLALSVLLFYLLITTWPVLDADACKPALDVCKKAFRPINLFGFTFSWSPDRQMLFTVMMAGAIGSLTHTLKSFGDYVGNRQLSENWIWFLLLRIPIGIALAVLFYCIIRGGLLLPTLPGQGSIDLHAQTTQLNPYGIAAFAALAGMFSKQATDKLAAIFDALFAMKDPVKRDGALDGAGLAPVTPKTLTQGKPQDVTLTGSGFTAETKATVNGKARAFKPASATQGVISILADDVKELGQLTLVVTNPDKTSFQARIVVEAAGAAQAPSLKPEITATDPKELTVGKEASLTITGRGFQPGCGVTVNGGERKPGSATPDTLVVHILANDVKNVGDVVKITVKNPDDSSSPEFSVKVVPV